jgi:hypothetical protein
MNSGNAGYHSVHNLMYSPLLSKNIKIGIYKTIFWPVVLYVCETLSLTLREEHKLSVRNYWVFGLFPSSDFLGTRKHDVSETESVSDLRCGGKTHSQLGPLD